MKDFDDSDYGEDFPCPECDEISSLSPITGLCYDCENAEIDEDDEDGEEDKDVCLECGQSFPSDVMEDGVCPLCLDEEEE